MVLVELTKPDGKKFLFDFDSQWEITDMGDKPAHWCNDKLGMNKFVAETYSEIKRKLAGQLLIS